MLRPGRQRKLRLSIAVTVALAATGAGAEGLDAAGELWMVRTHRVATGWRGPLKAAPLNYYRLDATGCWQRSAAEEFFAAPLPRPTVIHAHGGHTDDAWASRQGAALLQTLQRWRGEQPVRVVLWKWPSERGSQRLRTDLQINAARADYEGQVLAAWLRQFPNHAEVVLVGYSFGGRVITECLNRLGTELTRETKAPPLPQLRALLVAAAVDSDVLLPGRRGSKALVAAETLLVTRHQGDRVLRWYRHLEPGPSPHALGFAGPACPWLLGEARTRLEVLDLTGCIPGRHDFVHYLSATPLAARLAALVEFDDDGAERESRWQSASYAPGARP